jgi:RNA-splicing ligase RtcB
MSKATARSKCGLEASLSQLGTLGGGNHFIEICLDTEQSVWVMLHSGSRGIGNLIGQTFIELAREDCSHGAGRRMSRTAARKLFTVAEHQAATTGVECRKDESVIDETPAYKDIGAVMDAQRDLVETVHTLKQIVCVKG